MKLEAVDMFPAPGKHLCGMAFDGEMLWHSDGETHLLYQIDPKTHQIIRTISCPDVSTGLAFDGKHLWQVVGKHKHLICIDIPTGNIIRKLELLPDNNDICGIDIKGRILWLGREHIGLLEMRDITDGTLIQRFPAPDRIAGVTIVENHVWYTEAIRAELICVDARDGSSQGRYEIDGMPTGLTWDGKWFWYCDYASKTIKAVSI